jgi:hypothetical protein
MSKTGTFFDRGRTLKQRASGEVLIALGKSSSPDCIPNVSGIFCCKQNLSVADQVSSHFTRVTTLCAQYVHAVSHRDTILVYELIGTRFARRKAPYERTQSNEPAGYSA